MKLIFAALLLLAAAVTAETLMTGTSEAPMGEWIEVASFVETDAETMLAKPGFPVKLTKKQQLTTAEPQYYGEKKKKPTVFITPQYMVPKKDDKKTNKKPKHPTTFKTTFFAPLPKVNVKKAQATIPFKSVETPTQLAMKQKGWVQAGVDAKAPYPMDKKKEEKNPLSPAPIVGLVEIDSAEAETESQLESVNTPPFVPEGLVHPVVVASAEEFYAHADDFLAPDYSDEQLAETSEASPVEAVEELPVFAETQSESETEEQAEESSEEAAEESSEESAEESTEEAAESEESAEESAEEASEESEEAEGSEEEEVAAEEEEVAAEEEEQTEEATEEVAEEATEEETSEEAAEEETSEEEATEETSEDSSRFAETEEETSEESAEEETSEESTEEVAAEEEEVAAEEETSEEETSEEEAAAEEETSEEETTEEESAEEEEASEESAEEEEATEIVALEEEANPQEQATQAEETTESSIAPPTNTETEQEAGAAEDQLYDELESYLKDGEHPATTAANQEVAALEETSEITAEEVAEDEDIDALLMEVDNHLEGPSKGTPGHAVNAGQTWEDAQLARIDALHAAIKARDALTPKHAVKVLPFPEIKLGLTSEDSFQPEMKADEDAIPTEYIENVELAF